MGLVVPAGVEGEQVAFEHTLEKAYRVAAVPENQPVLGLVAPDNFEVQLFVELPGGLNVFYCQANRERAKLHLLISCVAITDWHLGAKVN